MLAAEGLLNYLIIVYYLFDVTYCAIFRFHKEDNIVLIFQIRGTLTANINGRICLPFFHIVLLGGSLLLLLSSCNYFFLLKYHVLLINNYGMLALWFLSSRLSSIRFCFIFFNDFGAVYQTWLITFELISGDQLPSMLILIKSAPKLNGKLRSLRVQCESALNEFIICAFMSRGIHHLMREVEACMSSFRV